MLPALLPLFGAPLIRWALGGAAVVALAAGLWWAVVSGPAARVAAAQAETAATIERLVAARAAEVAAARDAHWRGEIASSNAAVARAQAEAAAAALAAEATHTAAVAARDARIAELEARNAALPETAGGGLSRDRVRLLRARRGADTR